MKRIFDNSVFKLSVIYGYLLMMIIMILYAVPGIVDYNGQRDKKDRQISRNEYIMGGYLKDTKLFDLDGMYFPVAIDSNISEELYYVDSYGYERTYGGDRTHEGCDIMTVDNVRGQYPVVAVCDGTIEQMGWLELGGYRIGLKSESGVYYYYAHLHSYEAGIEEGMEVYAGQVIGYVGDTGYSKVEGTTGNFDVHLHFGIYLYDKDDNEYTVNPYYMLKELENSVIKYGFKKQ